MSETPPLAFVAVAFGADHAGAALKNTVAAVLCIEGFALHGPGACMRGFVDRGTGINFQGARHAARVARLARAGKPVT